MPLPHIRADVAAAVDEALRIAHSGLVQEIGHERACRVLALLAETVTALEPRLTLTPPHDYRRAKIQPPNRSAA